MKPRTHDAAKGKWKGILLQLGFEAKALTGKQGPCPMCGGKDRFTFDNQGGEGSYICRGCGSGGNGWSLLKAWKGWDFREAAAEVDKVLGNVTRADPVKRQRPIEDLKALAISLWNGAEKLAPDDLVCRYLALRGCPMPTRRAVLRFARLCPVPQETGGRLAMLALVHDAEGEPVTVHRTFLRPDGGKADMENPRALMPGELPDGSAVRLATHGEMLGIAEGIETALKAGDRFKVPTWAALTAGNMAKWVPPQGVKQVVIFGDCDMSFTGQAAAYALAKRLKVKGYEVRVEIPPRIGTDWADEEAA